MTSSLLIFPSLDCAASLALLNHFVIVIVLFVFAVFYVLSTAYFCCVSFALVASFSSIFLFSCPLDFLRYSFQLFSSSLLRLWSTDYHKFLLQRLPFTICHPAFKVSKLSTKIFEKLGICCAHNGHF